MSSQLDARNSAKIVNRWAHRHLALGLVDRETKVFQEIKPKNSIKRFSHGLAQR